MVAARGAAARHVLFLALVSVALAGETSAKGALVRRRGEVAANRGLSAGLPPAERAGTR